MGKEDIPKIIIFWFVLACFIGPLWKATDDNKGSGTAPASGGNGSVPKLSIFARTWQLTPLSVAWANQQPIIYFDTASSGPRSRVVAQNASNVPLFETVSVQLTAPAALEIAFEYGGGFSDVWGPLNTTTGADGSGSWQIGSRVFFGNALTGLEFLVDQFAQASAVTVASDGSFVSLKVKRSVASSQRVFDLHEVHRFEVASLSAGQSGLLGADAYLLYTVSGVEPWTEQFVYVLTSAPSSVRDPEDAPKFPARKRVVSRQSPSSIVEPLLQRKKDEDVKAAMLNIGNDGSRSPQDPSHSTQRKASAQGVNAAPAAGPLGQQYVMYLNNTWTLSGGLDINAFLIGLQGLVNRAGPRLFFVYPPTWAFTDTPSIFSFFSNVTLNPDLQFTQLNSIEEAIETFVWGNGAALPSPPKLVIWDTTSRESLLAAFTIAGIDDALVVSAQLVSTHFSAPGRVLPVVRDLRPIFGSMTTDLQAAEWVFANYWNRSNHNYIVWLGGVMGDVCHPGIADLGVSKRTLFFDLSTSPADTAGEYQLAQRILGGMNPSYTLLGWHAYSKDQEHTFTTLASQSKGSVEGLNTNPNLSFSMMVPLPANFTFAPKKQPLPSNTKDGVFVGLVQTDGLGLGAWVKPGRGDIPYSWEVTLPDLVLQPSVLRYFYSGATENDFFVAALGGPGYMYPKAVPSDYLPVQLGKAATAMQTLGLTSMVIFDASAIAANASFTSTGDTNLPKSIVDQYFSNIPFANGFTNGYAPSMTFESGSTPSGNPTCLVSFDYYVDPPRSDADVVKDLHMLTRANFLRPYFMSVHVREWNTEARMARIIASLANVTSQPVTPLSMDNLVALAARTFTFREHHH